MKRSSKPEVQEVMKKLSAYRENLKCTERLQYKLEELMSRAMCNSSPELSDMPKGGQPLTMDELVCEKVELEGRLERSKEKTARLRQATLETIDSLTSPSEVDVLEKYYVYGMNLEEIADDISYSVRQVERIFYDGLEELSKAA